VPRVLRETLVGLRELVLAWGPFILIGIALLLAAYWLLDPQPPKRVVLATGPERSAYDDFGKRYKAELARFGIEVVLKPSRGSFENLRSLRDAKSDVDLAFVQGGSSEAARPVDEEDDDGPKLVSLGSLSYEPVWVFYRGKTQLGQMAGLKGRRVNVGARGSGTPGLVAKLLAANHLEREDLKRTNLDETPAVVALLGGELDAAVLVSAPESQMVQMLLQTPGIRLLEFPQAEAYARRLPFMSPVRLPRGVADVARDVPSRDLQLVATTTALVAREGTHPALVQLFVQAASRIHGRAGWLARAGEFPSAAHSEFPLARDAERYYRVGPPLLQRYLPFWLANLVDRMWVALFSIIAVLVPLSRLVPPLYRFRVRSRIFRWYRQLRQIEESIGRKDPAKLLEELEGLDARAARIVVPLSYNDELYSLRSHIDLVRERLLKSR
jgi:TRAP transporter TAXI family solute receptor